MKKSERDFWRDESLPEQQRLYKDKLNTLDYWDDLADRLETRPGLVNQLNDGALAGYFREVMSQTAAAGVNPLASAPDLASDAAGLADRAVKTGQQDPYFVYGYAGREASHADRELPDRRLVLTLRRGQRERLPRYAVTDGAKIQEVTAQPREDAAADGREPWFAPTPGGEQARVMARVKLAKGEPVKLSGDEVGPDPGVAPSGRCSTTTGC